jgi:hypothetical protein
MSARQAYPSVPIGEISEVNPKGPKKGELTSDFEADFLPMADLHEDGSMAVTNRRPYSEVAKGYTAFKRGDVLLAKITPCFENNKLGSRRSLQNGHLARLNTMSCAPGLWSTPNTSPIFFARILSGILVKNA